MARHGTSPLVPAKVPDLIGVQERRYLDATGLVRHRDIGDLMRYAALNQGADVCSLPRFRSREAVPFLFGEDCRPIRQCWTRTIQRRAALRARPLHLFPQAAAESEYVRCARRTRTEGLRARRLRQLPHAAALHEQQADPCGGIHAASRPRREVRHPERVSWDRSGSRTENSARHRLLQSAVAQRRLVSRAVRA